MGDFIKSSLYDSILKPDSGFFESGATTALVETLWPAAAAFEYFLPDNKSRKLKYKLNRSKFYFSEKDLPPAVTSRGGFKKSLQSRVMPGNKGKGRGGGRKRTVRNNGVSPQDRLKVNNFKQRAVALRARYNSKGKSFKGQKRGGSSVQPRLVYKSQPVAKTAIVPSGPRSKFNQKGGSNVRMQFRVFYDEVHYISHWDATTGASDNAAVTLFDTYTNPSVPVPYTMIIVHPGWVFYNLNSIYKLASCFQFFKVHSIAFEYDPSATTATDLNFTVASAPDVEYPEAHGMKAANSVLGMVAGEPAIPIPHQRLCMIKNAKTLNVYRPFLHHCDVSRKKYPTTVDWDGQIEINYNNMSSSVLRDVCAGAFMLSGTAPKPSGTNENKGYWTSLGKMGDLFQIWDVEFIGFGDDIAASTGAFTRILTDEDRMFRRLLVRFEQERKLEIHAAHDRKYHIPQGLLEADLAESQLLDDPVLVDNYERMPNGGIVPTGTRLKVKSNSNKSVKSTGSTRGS